MIIGVPTEIKPQENRVGLVPSSVFELTNQGHHVYIQSGAGLGIGMTDEDYTAVGAEILTTAEEIFKKSEMIVKVKEPQAPEISLLRKDQILFTYLHLAPDPEQTKGLIESGCIAVAYETVTAHNGSLPLLAPMSEVAGRLSIQAGATALQRSTGGSGVLLSGVPGVAPGRVCIIGGGVVGTNAAKIAMGMGARVTILDLSLQRLRELDDLFEGRIKTIHASSHNLEETVKGSDLVIGAVLVPGGSAPKLVKKEHLSQMRPGSVLVDVAIDQGGCFETSRPTTHENPTYIVDDVVHYCVANMPGAVSRTSAFALNNATLPYVVQIARKGIKQALMDDAHLMEGLNICRGHVTYKSVADELGYDFVNPQDVL